MDIFEGKDEAQARKEILDLVSEYCDKYHRKEETSRIPYSKRVYDHDDMVNLVDASLDFWLTAGRYTEEFEKGLCEYLDVKYCSFVNSGSSAILLAFTALTSPMLGDRRILPGDEVITIACTFPTTISPITMYGAIPVFVDTTIPQYNIDTDSLESALSDRTKAIIMAHTLGNPFDIQKVKDFCDKHNLWLIEDNCDSLGSKYLYNGELKYTGTVGDIGTSSFYPPHHITTGEGGATYTNDPLLHRIMRSLRDWGRDCTCPPGKDDVCGKRFSKQFGTLPFGFDHKYVYSHMGFNLKATDLQAAIGCSQLKKIDSFKSARQKNFNHLKEGLKCLEGRIILPEAMPGSDPDWFGFPITCENGAERDRLISRLERSSIQTRTLFSGNITRHPCFEHLVEGKDYRIVGDLEGTDRIMRDTFWIGVYPGLTDKDLDRMVDTIKEAMK
ncbi:MAG: lipopolysaccharide biosynthesis protein RfbH [Candidatus Methanomethylophilaceae archaeon]|nr:lipopolysaccharide biosynthesis protein RfbH [Candidatus Methanomethylophilaceae archaeon]